MARFKLDAHTWEAPRSLRDYQDYILGDEPDETGRPFPSPSLDRKCRLIVVAAIRAIWNELPDPRCRTAVELIEEFADDLDHAKNTEAESVARQVEEDAYDRLDRNRDDRSASLDHHTAGIVCIAVGVDAFGPNEGPTFIRYSWTQVLDELNGDLSYKVRLVNCIFGNPFRSVTVNPSWLTSTVTALARGIYADRAFDRLPILADALQDAGCDHPDVLAHCRSDGPHARGCWVVDLLLGKS